LVCNKSLENEGDEIKRQRRGDHCEFLVTKKWSEKSGTDRKREEAEVKVQVSQC
jgi:hypothetical protein